MSDFAYYVTICNGCGLSDVL